ncbi:glutathione-binding protein GsiB precursor [Peptococcaceae bacterium CEB3]|nr:glutathione-binding protein GsiB precursor [Peptococcaceae bacterium CEB3]
MKKTGLVALLLVLILSLVGCGAMNVASSGAPASGKPGGTLVIAESSDATKLDPQLGTDIPSANVYFGKIYEGLVGQNDKMEIVPLLATSWQRVDPNTWEFKLRHGVKFQDGTPFNAAAVKKNFDRILDPKTASPRASLFSMVKDMKVVDDYTIQFITSYPYTPLLVNLAHYAGCIISPKAIDDYGLKLGDHPVGTGPFTFESWTPGQQITLVRNDNYWGQKAKVDKVVFKVVPEDATRVAMVQTGEAQLAEPILATDIDQITKSSSMQLIRTPALTNDYLGFNVRKKPFDDVRVRQAIAYAIDTDAIMKGVFNNVGTKANGPMGPKVFGYDPGLKGYPYDINKAKELLKAAGYPNGFNTTIWTNNNATREKLAEVLQSELKGIGVNVQIKVMEWGAYLEATAKGEQDMYILGWSNMTGDADYNQYYLFDSKAMGNPGNRSFYNNPEVDNLIQQGRSESDLTKRKAIYAHAQEIEMKELPMIFLRNQELLVAAGKNVKGLWVHPADILMVTNVTVQ